MWLPKINLHTPLSSIPWIGFPTWNPTATPHGSFGVDLASGSVQDSQSNASWKPFHTLVFCIASTLQLFDDQSYPAWTDHVRRESDYNNGVKDHADDPKPGFCGGHLLKLCPHALHPHGHPNVNNTVPGHFLSPYK